MKQLRSIGVLRQFKPEFYPRDPGEELGDVAEEALSELESLAEKLDESQRELHNISRALDDVLGKVEGWYNIIRDPEDKTPDEELVAHFGEEMLEVLERFHGDWHPEPEDA